MADDNETVVGAIRLAGKPLDEAVRCPEISTLDGFVEPTPGGDEKSSCDREPPPLARRTEYMHAGFRYSKAGR